MARLHARLLRQFVAANMDGGWNYNVVRDRTMADNLSWILHQGGSDARVVAWAHNIHMADFIAPYPDNPVPMAGYHLRRLYGDDVVIVSLHSERGGITALDTLDPAVGLKTFDLGPAPARTMEGRLADAGLDVAIVDLRALPADGPIAEWFGSPQATRFSWGGYDRSAPEDHITEYVFPEAFDVLAFTRRSEPTRPIEPADYGEVPVLTRPLNLGFEHGRIDAVPSGWFAWSKLRRLGFEIGTVAEEPAEGRRAARIRRGSGDAVGVAGSLLQQVDAGPYRGCRVRVRASVREELGEGGLAYLRLRAVPSGVQEVHDLLEVVLDTLDGYRVSGSEWHRLEIEATIPESAGTLVYGLFLSGTGSAWIDDVSLTVLDR